MSSPVTFRTPNFLLFLAVLPCQAIARKAVFQPLRLLPLAIKEAGYCVSCGYNLTGNVSGRCPECGEPIASFNPSQKDA
jgi:hypothetical protein